VCPHNQGLVPVNNDFATSAFPGAHPQLLPLLNISKTDFNRVVRPSSIGWIGRTRLRRNAAVAAGNLGSDDATPELIRMLEDTNAVLREHAAWALGQIETSDACETPPATA
jgi:epoxyqueuosine reductase